MTRQKTRLLCAVFLLGACGDAETSDDYSAIYADLSHWLCHPDQSMESDECRRNLDATVVWPDGTTEVEPHVAAAEPSVDCFYVYPTASVDGAPNSDLNAGEEEPFAVFNQFARYTEVCRTFAPLYRQGTITALLFGGQPSDRELAYGDVRDAFRHYLSQSSQGRGFLLVGHSQGAGILRRLIQEEIEPDAALGERMIAAHLLGSTVAIPSGLDVGGDFRETPLCRRADQYGCVVTYATYRATDPPLEATGIFGRTGSSATAAACTHPGMLMGGEASGDAYFPSAYVGALSAVVGEAPSPFALPEMNEPITTPYYKMPGLVSAECVMAGEFSYLEVRINQDEMDPRADDIGGDFQEGWGLHLADATLFLGDLVRLAASQSEAWLAR